MRNKSTVIVLRASEGLPVHNIFYFSLSFENELIVRVYVSQNISLIKWLWSRWVDWIADKLKRFKYKQHERVL